MPLTDSPLEERTVFTIGLYSTGSQEQSQVLVYNRLEPETRTLDVGGGGGGETYGQQLSPPGSPVFQPSSDRHHWPGRGLPFHPTSQEADVHPLDSAVCRFMYWVRNQTAYSPSSLPILR